MPILAELVRVVIGVDTHKHSHTAAVVATATGAVIEQMTVPATPAGYQQLLKQADSAITGGCGRSRAPAATAPA